MTDINGYVHSLKIKWFRRCVSNSSSKCYKLMNTLVFNTGKMFCKD